jgi:Skp family chaperone for outer membrane proteins
MTARRSPCRPAWVCTLPPFLQDAVDGREDQERQPGAEQNQGRTAEGPAGELALFDRLDAAVDCQERQQSHGQREQHAHHDRAASAQQREHQHAERDRDDSDVGA